MKPIKLPNANELRKQNADRRRKAADHSHAIGMQRATNAILKAHDEGKTEAYCQSFIESVVKELRDNGYTVVTSDRESSAHISW